VVDEIFVKIIDMDTKEARIRIEALIKELTLIHQELGESEPVVPAKTTDLISKGMCIQCGKPLPTKPNRGDIDRFCHNTCAQTVRRRIDDGELTDKQAVEMGAWGPRKTAGRKRKQIKAITPFVAESADRYAQDDSPNKSTSKAKKKGES
jgi:hypothetical protein